MNLTVPRARPPLAAPRLAAVLAAALIAAALAAYWGSFSGPFLADDLGAIVGNTTLQHLGSALSPPTTGTPAEGRPLVNLSLALNYAIGGTSPWSYHVFNFSIHAMAGLILFGLVRRTLAGLAGGDSFQAPWIAFAAALIWTLHPIQTEAVTYLSQRAESLMGLFYLLTLYGFVRGVGFGADDRVVGRPEMVRPGWLALSAVSCLCGMASKEVMVTAPLMVLLYDRTFVSGSFRESWRRRRGYLLALCGSWLLLAALMIGSADRAGTLGFRTGVPWWAYALTQFRAVAHYLRLSLWPRPLVADYGRTLGGPPLEVAGDALVVGVLVIASLILLARRSPLGFLGAWFFVILAPSSSIVPVATEIIAERRVYLSLAAVAVALVLAVIAASGWVAGRMGEGRSASASGSSAGLIFGLGICLLIAGGFAVLTNRRNEVYRSATAFWTDVALKVPDNAGAQNNLGNLLAEQSRFAEAEGRYRQALSLVPEYADAHGNLGHLLLNQGRLPEAIEHYRAALRYRPDDEEIRRPLGLACYQLGSSQADAGQLEQAAETYGTAVRMLPDLAAAHVDFGIVLARLGRGQDAMRELGEALRLEPAAADVHNNLGSLLAENGRLPEARAQFEEAIRLKPDYAEARENLRRVMSLLIRDLPDGGARP